MQNKRWPPQVAFGSDSISVTVSLRSSTVTALYSGHFGTRKSVCCAEVSTIQRLFHVHSNQSGSIRTVCHSLSNSTIRGVCHKRFTVLADFYGNITMKMLFHTTSQARP